MALALYRSYRPRRFSEVAGQDDVAGALKNQVAAGKVSHAYLFTGMRGTGKTSLARILAKAVNCPSQKDGEPCGVCEICTGIDNGSILDVTEIDAASNNGVDHIRDLRDETAYTPAVTDKRVYIIDEVHMLSAGAFNALLKIMEEPPEHVMFILATTEIHKVPATVLSRCQRFDLKRIGNTVLSKRLLEVAEGEGIDLRPDGAAAIARLADGAMRDALSILDTTASLGGVVDAAAVNRFAGTAETGYLFLLADSIAQRDVAGALKEIDSLYAGSAGSPALCGELLLHFRNLLMLKVAGKEMLRDYSAEDVERYSEQAGLFSEGSILSVLEELKSLAGLLPGAPDKRLQLELSFLTLCGAAPEKRPLELSVPSIAEPGKPMTEPSVPVVKQKSPAVDDGRPEPDGSVADAAETAGETAAGEFLEWPRVIEAMKHKNGMLYGFMINSKAYRTPTHILIDCGEPFKEKMRENREYTDIIKEVIAAETGVRLPIGPYQLKSGEMEKNGETSSLEELIRRAGDIGIPVEII